MFQTQKACVPIVCYQMNGRFRALQSQYEIYLVREMNHTSSFNKIYIDEMIEHLYCASSRGVSSMALKTHSGVARMGLFRVY